MYLLSYKVDKASKLENENGDPDETTFDFLHFFPLEELCFLYSKVLFSDKTRSSFTASFWISLACKMSDPHSSHANIAQVSMTYPV